VTFGLGASSASLDDMVAVYINDADPERAPEGRHACAQFSLVISNPHDPTIYTVNGMCFDRYQRVYFDLLFGPLQTHATALLTLKN
jgi:hypothetical protein